MRTLHEVTMGAPPTSVDTHATNDWPTDNDNDNENGYQAHLKVGANVMWAAMRGRSEYKYVDSRGSRRHHDDPDDDSNYAGDRPEYVQGDDSDDDLNIVYVTSPPASSSHNSKGKGDELHHQSSSSSSSSSKPSGKVGAEMSHIPPPPPHGSSTHPPTHNHLPHGQIGDGDGHTNPPLRPPRAPMDSITGKVDFLSELKTRVPRNDAVADDGPTTR